MIKTTTASPVRISGYDPQKLGSGTGITRYAAGLYFGSPKVSGKYLDDYANYGDADNAITHKGMEVLPESNAFKVASLLIKNKMNGELVLDLIKNEPELVQAFEVLTLDDEYDFEYHKGIPYDVTLKGVSLENLPYWDDSAGPEFILLAGEELLEQLITPELIQSEDWGNLDMEIPESYVDMVESAFSEAESWCAENDMELSVDSDEIREIWDHYFLGDTLVNSNLYDDFYETLYNSPHFEAIQRIVDNKVDMNSEMTFGDLYISITHSLKSPGESLDNAKKHSSEFLSKRLGVPGFKADNINFEEFELIVFDEVVLKDSSFVELTHDEFYEKRSDSSYPEMERNNPRNMNDGEIFSPLTIRR